MTIYADYEYADNTTRLAAYLRRSAEHQAADPQAWRWRQMAGESVKRRVRGGFKGKVISLAGAKARASIR